MNDIFIEMQYNKREFDGISEFEQELTKNYNFQLEPKWISAASEGAEFWITVFINSDIGKFLVSAFLGGLTWDLIKVGAKKYLLTPLFSALESLNKANEPNWGGLKILKLKFQFDDCEIHIGGLKKNFSLVISTVFNEVAKKKPRFENEIGNEVIKIELPIICEEQSELTQKEKYKIDVYNDDYSIDTFKKLWKITFLTNCPVMIYNFNKDELRDL